MGSKESPSYISKLYGGDSVWFKNEFPSHQVKITEAFMISKYEVTYDQFASFVKAKNYLTEAEKKNKIMCWNGNVREEKSGLSWKNPGYKLEGNYPVVCVTWKDAMSFVEWLNASAPGPPLGYTYDLPTEAEWEYCCRAGSSDIFFWGSNENDAKLYCNLADSSGAKAHGWKDHFMYNDNYSESAPIGSFKPNKWGIYDMIGNVYEWTKDSGTNDDTFYYTNPEEDPCNTTSDNRHMLKGGSWHSNQRGARPSKRKAYSTELAADNIGFRLVIRKI